MSQEKQRSASKWKINDAGDKNLENLLSRALGVHSLISRILISRGMKDIETAQRYLRPSLHDLHSPFLMKDMKKGVSRVIRAIHEKENILIYGDYDADGITAVVILYKFIRNLTPHVDYYIPDRVEEGYGLKMQAVENFKKNNIRLIITVDCGISDVEQISYARDFGIDTIVLDHHEVSDALPPAVAAINPNREDCPFPFKGLAGVGIAFNFLIALRSTLSKEGFWKNNQHPNLKEYLDIVALGTIGDVVPLVDENRIFSKIGLELITEGKRPGIKALKEVSGVDNQIIDSIKASFSLIPRINAAGRIATSADAVKLLLTDHLDEARVFAEKLDSYNRQRQMMERKILAEIMEIIDRNPDIEKKSALVFASEKWHPGVVGIVASRLVELYNRPAIVISLNNGIGKGSGRSIAGYNLFKGVQHCAEFLLSYGGHYHAVGITIAKQHIDDFYRRFDEFTRQSLENLEDIAGNTADSLCQLSDINHELVRQIEMLAPFGSHNPEPLLYASNVTATASSVLGGNHLKIYVKHNGVTFESIWFNMARSFPEIKNANLDMIFTPQLNNWNGAMDIQLKIKDVIFSA